MAQERTGTPQPPLRDGLSTSMPRRSAESPEAADNAGNAIDANSLKRSPISSGDRAERIAKSAYAKAEQRGFEPGYEWDDWFSAEQEIDAEIQALMSRTSLPGS
jgi:hypothetical protein